VIDDAPSNYKTAGTLMLVAGVVNLVVAAFLSLFFALYGLATYGLCCVCCFLPIGLMGFGVFEVVTGNNMQRGEPVHNAQIVSLIGIVIGALFGGGLSMILEIVALVFLNDDKVKAWLASREPVLIE
jgi:hypothetical protein